MSTRRRRKSTLLHLEQLEVRKLLAGVIGDDSGASLWTFVGRESIPTTYESSVRTTDYRLASLDVSAIQQKLSNSPQEYNAVDPTVLSIPRPNGGFDRFNIFVSSIMAPELAAKFPQIQTFAGQGLDDPTATIRFDVTPAGFHAQVLSPNGSYYIDPFTNQSNQYYAIYDRSDTAVDTGFSEMEESILGSRNGGSGSGADSSGSNANRTESRSGSELRVYRLAVAATGEYTRFHGGTVALGQAAIVTAINRVAGIYQTEMAISFELVANNDQLVYTDGATDPYTNDNGPVMLGENQANVDRLIGAANYDMGHVFSTGGGGIAALGSVGIDGIKAQGVTGLPTPIGDEFYVDYVSHEMGHQFGGDHSFNGIDGNCGARNGSTAYEPGSGTTIQAYAGICGTDDLQPHSDPYFHSVSLDQFVNHVDTRIATVGRRTPTGNTIPTVDAGSNYVIPASTPFVLTAVGSDPNVGDVLTYDWQQRDLGPAKAVSAPDDGQGPLFRVWSPTSDPTRTFPRLSDLVNNTTSIGETLPTTNRTMNFRVIARDNRASGGAFDVDNMSITVVNTGAPFRVTSPNTNVSYEGMKLQTITWDVAGTDANGINAANVNILLSTDGGLTYPLTLASNVPNDGSQEVRIPNNPTTKARIRIQGSNQIFFDISDVNFTIAPASQTIEIDLGGTKLFTENSAPIFIAPTASIRDLNVPTYANSQLTLSISANAETGDILSLSSEGNAAGQIDVDAIASLIRFGGTEIGTFSSTATSLSIQFNASVTRQAIEKVLSRVTFVHTSDDPTPNVRSVSVVLNNNQNGQSEPTTAEIQVLATNDPPQPANAVIASINEDTLSPAGSTISQLLNGSFRDPDRNSRLTGIAVVGNDEVTTSGLWQYSLNGNNWFSIGSVSTSSALFLSTTTLLRFLPAKDYFGTPKPLTYHLIDNTYTGAFTTGSNRQSAAVLTTPAGPYSLSVGRVTTEIIAVNDAPKANQPSIRLDVLEDALLQIPLDQAWFSDVDDATLNLVLRSRNGEPLPLWLAMDSQTQTVTGLPTNDQVGQYDLEVFATDSGGLTATIPFTLVVINTNDAPTNIELEGSTVPENRTGGLIGALAVSDVDSEDTFTFTISDPRFEVVGNLLYLKPGIQLDYEATPTVAFNVRVTDSGSPPLSLEMTKIISVIDENEFAPALNSMTFNISEAAVDESNVGVIVAPDKDTANTVTYRFVGNVPSEFVLNTATGEVKLAPGVKLNYEQKSRYQFFVEAYDDGKPSLATTAAINIDVLDVNEFDPGISNTTLSLSEGQATLLPFARLIGTDGDIGQTVTFSLLGSETRFSVDANTGDLSLLASGLFDYEASNISQLVVLVQDSGVPARTTQVTVTLNITDANDPPTAASIPNSQVPINVPGLNLGKISIVDQDVGQSYNIVPMDERFRVVDGNLMLKPGQSLSSLDPTNFDLPISVTESGSTVAYPLTISLQLIPNPRTWQNTNNRFDVDRDSSVGPLDVLAIINAINSDPAYVLVNPRPSNTFELPDYDVDGDRSISPLDVLTLINFINAQGSGEGEKSPTHVAPDSHANPRVDDATWLAAFTQLEEERLSRRRRS